MSITMWSLILSTNVTAHFHCVDGLGRNFDTGRAILNDHIYIYIYSIYLPDYRKLTPHEIKVLEINANLMENDFQIKKLNAKDEVEFIIREINAIETVGQIYFNNGCKTIQN